MLLTVLRLEWALMRRSRVFLVTLFAFGSLVLLSAHLGAQHVAEHQASVDTLFKENQTREQRWIKVLAEPPGDGASQRDDPRDPLFMGRTGAASVIALPTMPLSAMAVGSRARRPQAMRVAMGVHLEAETNTEVAMLGPSALGMGHFDLAFLFVVLFPLVVIALIYDVLSGERERGTLVMLLSQPLSQGSLVLGKALSRGLVLGASSLILLALGFMVAGVNFDSMETLRLGMCVSALVIGWGALWFAAGVLVNSFGLSSANNALILVGSWIAFVVILPGILHVSVSTFLPSVSSIHVMHEVREAGQKAKAELDALTGSHDDRRLAKGYAKRVVEIEQRIAAQAEPVLLEAHKQEQAQYDALRWLIYLSPASLVQARLEDLAGVSSRRYERFESQAEAFHGVFTEYFYGFINKGAPFESEGFDALPRFTFHDEPVADLVRRTLGGSLFLFLLSVLLVGGAWGRLRSIGRLTR